MHSFSEINSEYKKNGFVLLRNFFSAEKIVNIKKYLQNTDIENLGCKVYFEKNKGEKVIRRIEDFSKKLDFIQELLKDQKLNDYISNLMGAKATIFKEKINYKQAKKGSGFKLHVDGHFYWTSKEGNKKKGWKEYSDDFLNLVIPLDECSRSNGCLKIYPKTETHKKLGKNWESITNSLLDGGPYLKNKFTSKIRPFYVIMQPGDILFFNWMCIHGSDYNNSVKDRPILYITYNKIEDGNFMEKYFHDKKHSLSLESEKSLR